MTQAEYIADLQLLSDAFRGNSQAQMEAIVRRSVNEYSQYHPKYIASLDNATNDDGEYTLPSGAKGVIMVVDSYYQSEIHFGVRENDDNSRTLELGRLKLPSDEGLNSVNYYKDPYNYASGTFSGDYETGVVSLGDSYSKFDYAWYRPRTIDEIPDRVLNTLMLYSEYLAYRDKAGQTQYHEQLTDSDPSGAQTTVRNVTSADYFTRLAKQSKEDYDSKMVSTFGIRDRVASSLERGYSYGRSKYLLKFVNYANKG